MSMKNRLIAIIKQVWLVIIFVAVGWYFVQQAPILIENIQQVEVWRVVLALGCLVLGKFALVALSLYTVRDTAWQATFREMFVVNAYSQLAKYLPGGIWHFVSRAGYYQLHDLSLKDTTRAMIIENIWLVISAFFVGTLLLMSAYMEQAVIGLGISIVLWLVATWMIARWTQPKQTIVTVFRMIVLQCLIWLPLGISYTVILPLDLSPNVILISASGFILSWLIGYVTIFAPGGIGIREIILSAIMLLLLSSELSLFYATLHRILWVLVELLLGLITFIFFRE